MGVTFLPQFAGKGYAHEAAGALILKFKQLQTFTVFLATTLPDNEKNEVIGPLFHLTNFMKTHQQQ